MIRRWLVTKILERQHTVRCGPSSQEKVDLEHLATFDDITTTYNVQTSRSKMSFTALHKQLSPPLLTANADSFSYYYSFIIIKNAKPPSLQLLVFVLWLWWRWWEWLPSSISVSNTIHTQTSACWTSHDYSVTTNNKIIFHRQVYYSNQ